MFSNFYTDNGQFEPRSFEHIAAVLICFFLGILLIRKGKTSSQVLALKYALGTSLFIASTQAFKVIFKLLTNRFDVTEDLPLHLCNMIPFLLVFAFWKKNQKLFKILAFWVMAGTLQAVFTPTLTESLPHYEAIRYWVVHVGLPIIVIYSIYVLGWKLHYKDVILSIIALNLQAFVLYHFNNIVGSNYIYINGKPEGTTLYSILPEWPTYILCLEGIAIVLFSLVWLLFYPVSRAFDRKQAAKTS